MSEKVILCVDDEEIVLSSLREQICDHFGDYACEVAESADEAWEVIEELSEDGVEVLVIVSDWLMPGIKGDEFLISVHQKFPKIIKVILTGQAEDDAIKRAKQEANLYSCLRKPWHVEELITTIRSGLADNKLESL
ncbi:response regulator [Candidatus Parabeggiatoa sp. HSG14]|uniref:response regulator n=1 Tax=Candidatus Parabeggiatoa sp. HSG14 TaxID=3055593 RepID=UPI0025A7369F|nr:response regulator [Thiotrichales bacterium HSG14]